MDELIQDLRQRRDRLKQGGGPDRLAKQREQGKLTARERIDAIVDPGSLQEFGLFAQHRQTQFGMADKECPADGVVTGAATVDGRLVHLASQDFTVLGGSAGEVHSLKVADAMARSLKTGSPFVFINDSGGAACRRASTRYPAMARCFYTNVCSRARAADFADLRALRRGAAYSPALTDFVIQTRQAQMFITGPQVIKQVTGEQITAEALGGAEAHMSHSGVIHFIAENDDEAAVCIVDACSVSCHRTISKMPPRVHSTIASIPIRS